MTLSLISDELAQASTKKKEFLSIMESFAQCSVFLYRQMHLNRFSSDDSNPLRKAVHTRLLPFQQL